MYLILIGWLYVVLMLAVAQDSIVRALVILFFLGFLPTFLLAQLARRRQRRREEERDEQASGS